MRCPKCGCQEDKVIDSRASGGGTTIRRRRECTGCAHRYTTYEEIERPRLMIVKRDGRSEELSRVKLTASILKACQKRPVPQEAIDSLVEKIIDDLGNNFDREVPYGAVGTRVMEGLRSLDPVAYVRYASVYRDFQDEQAFFNELKNLMRQKGT